jgi:hypothetical protein
MIEGFAGGVRTGNDTGADEGRQPSSGAVDGSRVEWMQSRRWSALLWVAQGLAVGPWMPIMVTFSPYVRRVH